MNQKFVIICGISALLAGCSLAPRNTGSAYMFALSPVTAVQKERTALRLGVDFPAAAPELDTARIALNRQGKTWDYYAGARWSDFLPVIVQDNIAKTIESAGIFSSVAVDAGATADEVLKMEIRSFQAEYPPTRAAPVIRVRLQVTLLDRRSLHPLASFGAAGTREASADSLPAIQSAFRDAFTAAERQLVASLAKAVTPGH